MEGHVSKRRRIYSLEPNKLVSATFAQKYVNYLVPALMKMDKNLSSDEDGDCEIEKTVRYEVDMALVFSADGFAWSHALREKLQRDNNVGRLHNSTKLLLQYSQNNPFGLIEEKVNDSLPWPPVQNTFVPTIFSPNPNCNPKIGKLKRPKRLLLRPRKKKEADKESEEEQFSRRLTNLRALLPGGNEMDVNNLLTEVGSYLVCLDLQVNILRCLVETQ